MEHEFADTARGRVPAMTGIVLAASSEAAVLVDIRASMPRFDPRKALRNSQQPVYPIGAVLVVTGFVLQSFQYLAVLFGIRVN